MQFGRWSWFRTMLSSLRKTHNWDDKSMISINELLNNCGHWEDKKFPLNFSWKIRNYIPVLNHFVPGFVLVKLFDVGYNKICGPDSSVDIVTGYGLDGLGIEFRWGRDFLHLSRPALGPTQPASCTMGTGSFPVVKSSRGATLTPHWLLVPWSRKVRAIPLPLP
jgi:hypothetical protein